MFFFWQVRKALNNRPTGKKSSQKVANAFGSEDEQGDVAMESLLEDEESSPQAGTSAARGRGGGRGRGGRGAAAAEGRGRGRGKGARGGATAKKAAVCSSIYLFETKKLWK